MTTQTRVPAGSPTGGQFSSTAGAEAPPLATFGPSDDFGAMPANVASALIDRRVSRGGRSDDSESLLRQLLDRHRGENLVHALTYEAFGSEAQCRKAVSTLEGVKP